MPTNWYLEGFTDDTQRLRRLPILQLPFRIGRHANMDLTLRSDLVSGKHSEIVLEDGRLKLRDLNSTNGTYANGERLTQDFELTEGDILHVAHYEFRLGALQANNSEALFDETMAVNLELPKPQVEKTRSFRQLMERRAVTVVFQPLVDFQESAVFGYEVLGRGSYQGLPTAIQELFQLAASLEAEAELSRILRQEGIAACAGLPGDPLVFINIHPAEINDGKLLESLAQTRAAAPEQRLALEIHEKAVTDPPTIRRIRDVLNDLQIQLAYDDFGAGQSRLLELTEVPPDFVKFDMSLVRGIDKASDARRTLLRNLLKIPIELGIKTLAEGIETQAEADTCRDLGFQYGQGYFFGSPMPVAAFGGDSS